MELTFDRLHRAGYAGVWRPLLGVILAVGGSLVLLPALVVPVFVLLAALAGFSPGMTLDRVSDLSVMSPMLLAFVNVALASSILWIWAITRVLHGLKPRWVSSVGPRLRWRYLAACAVAAVATMLVVVALSLLLPGADPNGAVGGSVNRFTEQSRSYLLIIALLTPLQAAGEEYVYRGYLTQAFGGAIGGNVGRWLAVIGPALVFAFAHGSQDLPIFLDRFAFGLVAGVLVVRTGGLEAGIAMHVINNWVALGLAVIFGDMATVLTPTGGNWATIVVTLVQSLLYLVLALGLARWMDVRHRVSGELVGPVRRV
ncbi:MAG: CPBP family intramembrane glutamic endopeptidase [Nocardioides sp.]